MMYSAGQGLGYDLSKHCVRQVEKEDIDRFDHIIAMDRQVCYSCDSFGNYSLQFKNALCFFILILYFAFCGMQNLRDLRELFPSEKHDKVSLFSKWDPEHTDKYDNRDVPDPYFCGGHANVVKLVEGGIEAIGKKLGMNLD